MAKPQRRTEIQSAGGLFRAVLGRPGISFKDFFAQLERSPLVERLTRHPKRGILWAQVSLAPHDGAGYFEFTRIRDDIFVIVENFAFKDPRLERVGGDGLIQFNFRLAGDLTMGVSRSTSLRLVKPSLFIWNQPKGLDVDEWTAPAAQERAVAISVHPQFLLDQFQLSSLDSSAPLQQFLANSSNQLSYLQLPLTATMFELAAKLVSNKHSGTVRLVYIETVAMELLCEAVASVAALSEAPNEQYSDRQLRALHAARSFLMRQFSPPPTVKHVARVSGMSETILKRAFKQVFGETVGAFSTRCRMQRAMQLLRDERVQVGKAGDAVGYRHHTSFATAFRKHFGMRPKDVLPVRDT